MMGVDELVKTEIKGGIAVVTLDNPPVNSLNQAVMAGLGNVLEQLERDGDLRAVVLTGAGEKAFVAGADIKEFTGWTSETGARHIAAGQRLFSRVENLPVPVIAAVNGFALGGGLELALSCDIRIASKNAKMSLPEVGLGLIPGYGGTQRLAQTINPGQAKLMVYTGEMIDAERARELGLVQVVTDRDGLMECAMALAARIAANAPMAVREAKRAINVQRNGAMRLGEPAELAGFSAAFSSEDRVEGIAAFVEKRKAVFKNR